MARSRRIFTGSGFTKLGLRLFGFAHVYHSSIECVVSRTLTKWHFGQCRHCLQPRIY